MPSLFDETEDVGKFLLVGDQGNGKTGAKAALVAIGYQLMMVDTDKGFKILRALLTDEEHYPYASYMKKNGITPRISYQPIEVPIDEIQIKDNKGISWDTLGPTSSRAWTQVIKLLREWKDGDKNYGAVTDWGPDVVLDFDTMSTLAEIAKIWAQDLNGHLGSMIDEHGRDTGIAQDKIGQLIMKMMNPSVRCNVIFTAHIKRVDMSNDVPQSPEARLREKKSIDPQGFPAVIGQASAPYVGKRFNDQFIVKRDGNGRSATRRIYTVPTDNTSTKNSVWLEDSYPVETGLASIMEALRYRPAPIEFLEHCKKFHETRKSTTSSKDRKDEKPTSLGGFGGQ